MHLSISKRLNGKSITYNLTYKKTSENQNSCKYGADRIKMLSIAIEFKWRNNLLKTIHFYLIFAYNNKTQFYLIQHFIQNIFVVFITFVVTIENGTYL